MAYVSYKLFLIKHNACIRGALYRKQEISSPCNVIGVLIIAVLTFLAVPETLLASGDNEETSAKRAHVTPRLVNRP